MKYLLSFAFLMLTSGYVFAIDLDSLEDEEETTPTLASAIEWSGLLDMRFAYHGSARSWRDPNGDFGGEGRTRYGRFRGGEGSGASFNLAQFSLVSDININNDLSAHIQLNISDHRDNVTGFGAPGIAEAYIKGNYGKVKTRLGFLIPNISLEHPNVAWSTKYTITPSAINSWIGEEIRTTGLEARYEFLDKFEVTGALFSQNDQSGIVLAHRGWALHDYQATYGSRIRWADPQYGAFSEPNGGWSSPFEEMDNKLGYYAKASTFTKSKNFRADLFYYDNQAELEIFNERNYTWRTKFWNLSLDYQVGNGLRFLMQAMTGTTRMDGVNENPASPNFGLTRSINARFNSAYLMASYLRGKHRFSARYDGFNIQDLNSDPITSQSDQEEEGWAGTLAYLYNISDQKTFGVEVVHVDSERKGVSTDDPDDSIFQIMYRLTF